MRRKILSVFGTRPEAVKMAPVVHELQKRPDQVHSVVLVTGQHRQMLDQVLDLFSIIPDYDLDVMRPDQTLTQTAAAILQGIEPVLHTEQPDWVLVQGDTTTVAAVSLAAFYAHTRVGHVEAGLRTRDKWQPFPEEINRRVAGAVADLHFAPTTWARDNLLREGVAPETVLVTGNPVIDALHWVSTRPYDPAQGPLANLLWERRIILVTAHRRENLGAPLAAICEALIQIAAHYAGQVQIVYPVHLNPHVQEPVYRLLGQVPDITLLPPLDYLPLVYLMKHCCLVLTDSGGIQEEAPGLGKPVLVLRTVTERPEGIAAGTARLVGTETREIVRQVCHLLDDPAAYREMAQAVNPYGDGLAAQRIVEAVLK